MANSESRTRSQRKLCRAVLSSSNTSNNERSFAICSRSRTFLGKFTAVRLYVEQDQLVVICE